MLKRIVLSIVVLASLVWLAIVAIDLFNDKNKYDPRSLFGYSDGEVLIINRPAEFNIEGVPSFNGSTNTEFLNQADHKQYDLAYVSRNRPQILLIRKSGWDTEQIKLLLKGQTLDNSNSDLLKFGEYNVRFQKTKLYLWKGEIQPSNPVDRIVYDKKATASILVYNSKNELDKYTDIYFKENGNIHFITANSQQASGNQIDDAAEFAAYIPADITGYHFYERDYYTSLDSSFLNSPMFMWCNKGFVDLTFKGERVIVSDYIDGQDPVLILQDITQEYDTTIFSIDLLNDFPSKNKSYSVKILEDVVVICEKPSIGDQFIAAIKLGNTIALDDQVSDAIYGSLPIKVSERVISGDSYYSKTVYRGKILEARSGPKVTVKKQSGESKSEHLACGFPVKDFVSFSGKGNVVALGSGGEIAGFINGSLTWKDKIDGEPIGRIQYIDLHGNGEDYVLLNTRNKIYVWNKNGEKVTGFPVQLEEDAINQVKFYRWKGNSFFLIASKGKISHFDAKGRELNIIKTTIDVTSRIDVWVSQNRLFAGYRNESHFVMYDLDKKRVHREFDIPSNVQTVKIPNEIVLFGINEHGLTRTDQKGNAIQTSPAPNTRLLEPVTRYKNPIIVSQSENMIHLYNLDGIPFGQITIPFNDIADLDIYINDSGKTYIAIVDALENNVYLYGADGNSLLSSPLEGQSRVRLQGDPRGKLITTIVDDYIIQYLEN